MSLPPLNNGGTRNDDDGDGALPLLDECQQLEKKLRSDRSKSVEPNQLREKLKSIYRQILCDHPRLAVHHKILVNLWKYVFYHDIDACRRKARRNSLEVSPNEPQRRLSMDLLPRANGFYQDLCQEHLKRACVSVLSSSPVLSASKSSQGESLESKSNLENGHSTEFIDDLACEGSKKVPLEGDAGSHLSSLIIAHQCMIYLGDLARYGGSYLLAQRFYQNAVTLIPSRGNAYHQLAVLACCCVDQDLSAVTKYFKSLSAVVPFNTAKDNLEILFQRHMVRHLGSEYTHMVHGNANHRLKKNRPPGARPEPNPSSVTSLSLDMAAIERLINEIEKIRRWPDLESHLICFLAIIYHQKDCEMGLYHHLKAAILDKTKRMVFQGLHGHMTSVIVPLSKSDVIKIQNDTTQYLGTGVANLGPVLDQCVDSQSVVGDETISVHKETTAGERSKKSMFKRVSMDLILCCMFLVDKSMDNGNFYRIATDWILSVLSCMMEVVSLQNLVLMEPISIAMQWLGQQFHVAIPDLEMKHWTDMPLKPDNLRANNEFFSQLANLLNLVDSGDLPTINENDSGSGTSISLSDSLNHELPTQVAEKSPSSVAKGPEGIKKADPADLPGPLHTPNLAASEGWVECDPFTDSEEMNFALNNPKNNESKTDESQESGQGESSKKPIIWTTRTHLLPEEKEMLGLTFFETPFFNDPSRCFLERRAHSGAKMRGYLDEEIRHGTSGGWRECGVMHDVLDHDVIRVRKLAAFAKIAMKRVTGVLVCDQGNWFSHRLLTKENQSEPVETGKLLEKMFNESRRHDQLLANQAAMLQAAQAQAAAHYAVQAGMPWKGDSRFNDRVDSFVHHSQEQFILNHPSNRFGRPERIPPQPHHPPETSRGRSFPQIPVARNRTIETRQFASVNSVFDNPRHMQRGPAMDGPSGGGRHQTGFPAHPTPPGHSPDADLPSWAQRALASRGQLQGQSHPLLRGVSPDYISTRPLDMRHPTSAGGGRLHSRSMVDLEMAAGARLRRPTGPVTPAGHETGQIYPVVESPHPIGSNNGSVHSMPDDVLADFSASAAMYNQVQQSLSSQRPMISSVRLPERAMEPVFPTSQPVSPRSPMFQRINPNFPQSQLYSPPAVSPSIPREPPQASPPLQLAAVAARKSRYRPRVSLGNTFQVLPELQEFHEPTTRHNDRLLWDHAVAGNEGNGGPRPGTPSSALRMPPGTAGSPVRRHHSISPGLPGSQIPNGPGIDRASRSMSNLYRSHGIPLGPDGVTRPSHHSQHGHHHRPSRHPPHPSSRNFPVGRQVLSHHQRHHHPPALYSQHSPPHHSGSPVRFPNGHVYNPPQNHSNFPTALQNPQAREYFESMLPPPY